MCRVNRKTASFESVSETAKDKLIRIIFITLLLNLCSSWDMRDKVRKFHGVKFARKIKIETSLRFLSHQLPEIQGGVTVQTLRGRDK